MMNRKVVLLGLVLLGFLSLDAQIVSKDLKDGVRIKSGEKYIDVARGFSACSFYDWDGDNKRDLLVGQYKDGGIRFYKNTGNIGNPVFAEFKYLEVDNKPLTTKVH